METIVLGYDESASANAALAQTITLAQQTGARVVAVFGCYVNPLVGVSARDYTHELETIGKHALARAVAQLELAGIDAESRLESGKPADVILQTAGEVDADVIAVGTVGENPITRALLGSVVLRLVQRSTIPVLVVPEEGG